MNTAEEMSVVKKTSEKKHVWEKTRKRRKSYIYN